MAAIAIGEPYGLLYGPVSSPKGAKNGKKLAIFGNLSQFNKRSNGVNVMIEFIIFVVGIIVGWIAYNEYTEYLLAVAEGKNPDG